MIEAHGLLDVVDGQAHTHVDDVRRGRRLGLGRLVRLHDFDEVAVRVLDHDHSRGVTGAERQYCGRATGGHDRRALRFHARERRVDVAYEHDQRVRARVLRPALERFAARAGNLDDLDAGSHAAGPTDQPAQRRVRQAEHVAQRFVLVGVARLALRLEPEPVAVERDGFVEVADDRAEEVAVAGHERSRLRVRTRAEQPAQQEHR